MNTLTVSLVTIMILGVIMALIYDTYTQHKSWDSFRYVLMSVVFGIVTYSGNAGSSELISTDCRDR